MSINIHQRHLLKSKDIKQLIQQVTAQYGEQIADTMISSKAKVEWIKIDNNEELYAIDNVLAFWVSEGKYIPLLSYLLKKPLPIKAVKVDAGAIKFVSGGADVMRPGITTIDPSIQVDDIILIQDGVHSRTLAVGKALFDGPTMEKMDKGKVIKSVHSLKDSIWEFSKTFK
jgi:PUA domain protein